MSGKHAEHYAAAFDAQAPRRVRTQGFPVDRSSVPLGVAGAAPLGAPFGASLGALLGVALGVPLAFAAADAGRAICTEFPNIHWLCSRSFFVVASMLTSIGKSSFCAGVTIESATSGCSQKMRQYDFTDFDALSISAFPAAPFPRAR